jgi:hypothetical protein
MPPRGEEEGLIARDIERAERLRQFFQKDRKRTLDFDNYHRQFYSEKFKDYNYRNVDTPTSRMYLLKEIPNKGDTVVNGIIRTITNLRSIELYPYQLDFVKVIIPTLFKYIYKDEWNTNRREILARHGMKEVYDEVFFISPRRMGKTITLGYTCLSIAANMIKDPIRPFDIAVFATTRDASKRFIDECALGWKNIDINYKFYFEKTASQITLTNKKNPTDIRYIKSFAGSGVVSIFLFKKKFTISTHTHTHTHTYKHFFSNKKQKNLFTKPIHRMTHSFQSTQNIICGYSFSLTMFHICDSIFESFL